MTSIVVTGQIPSAGLDVLHECGDVWQWSGDGAIDRAVLLERLANADAAVTLLSERVDDELLDAAPHLRVVANVAVGFDNIDVTACERRGVIATNTPGVLTDATADLAIGLMLMVTRRLGEGERLVRAGTEWKWSMFMLLGTGVQGATLGIVGMGAIGQAVAQRARAFGMNVVYHNRTPVEPEVEAALDARYVSFDELVATSDVVSLHCPYSPATHHLFNAETFTAMQPHAFIVNTARGAVIDEAALVAALDAEQIAGAALDVYEREPVVHPGLLGRDDVALTPHLGSATVDTRAAMATLAARNVEAVLAGKPPLTPITTT